MTVNETLQQAGEIVRNTELTTTLKQITGLHVTAKMQKGARLFEFSTGKRMVASVYTYGKAKRWADGFRKGRRVEREMQSKGWRYEVRIGDDSVARFRDAEEAVRYVLLAETSSPVFYRVWDTQTKTYVDSLT